MLVRPARTAEEAIDAYLEKPRPNPPVLVCVNGRVIGSAVVIVSPKDPNWWRGMAVRRDGEIIVRPDEMLRRV